MSELDIHGSQWQGRGRDQSQIVQKKPQVQFVQQKLLTCQWKCFFFFVFFFRRRCKVSAIHSQNWPSQVTYGSRPACLKIRSTLWDGGHWPSAPLTPGSPSRDIATTRATVQKIKNPHRNRHACSARFSRGLKERAFARANVLRNDWVSTDQRPQTSTKRARPGRPTSSG